jgi:regulatory protein
VSGADRAGDRTAEPPAQRLQAALDVAYRHLARCDRTVAQVRGRLEAAGADPATIDAAVAELRRQGYLDDARFARRFVEDRRMLDAWGRERIEGGLRAAGVPAELVEAALAEPAGHDELTAATELLSRRLRAAPRSDRERERALGLLVRRGYELELAYDAVRAFEGRQTAS